MPADPLRNTALTRMFLMIAAVTLGLTVPAGADEAGERLLDEVVEAYRGLEGYRATVTMRAEGVEGGEASYSLVFDRGRGEPRLLMDGPMGKLRVAGDELAFVPAQLGDGQRYLEAELAGDEGDEGGVSYEQMVVANPLVAMSGAADLILLTSRDPVAWLSGFGEAKVETAGGEGEGTGLVIRGEGGTLRLTLDPRTRLIRKMAVEPDPMAAIDPTGAQQPQRQVVTFDVASTGEVGAEALMLDTGDAKPTDSLQELFTGEAEAAHPLLGEAVPGVSLVYADGQPVDLSKLDADVVVLDFWATWCGPCRFWMPQLAAIDEWAQAQGLSVKVLGVSMDEDQAAARAYWKEGEYEFPLVFPKDMAVTNEAFGRPQRGPGGRMTKGLGLPTTAVVHRGKVVAMESGVGPFSEPQMRARLMVLTEGKREMPE